MNKKLTKAIAITKKELYRSQFKLYSEPRHLQVHHYKLTQCWMQNEGHHMVKMWVVIHRDDRTEEGYERCINAINQAIQEETNENQNV